MYGFWYRPQNAHAHLPDNHRPTTTVLGYHRLKTTALDYHRLKTTALGYHRLQTKASASLLRVKLELPESKLRLFARRPAFVFLHRARATRTHKRHAASTKGPAPWNLHGNVLRVPATHPSQSPPPLPPPGATISWDKRLGVKNQLLTYFCQERTRQPA